MKKKIIKRLLRYMKPYMKYLAVGFLLSALAVACALLAPVLIGRVIDQMVGPDQVNFSRVVKGIISLLAVSLIGFVLQWIVGIYTGKASFLAMRDLREEAFQKIMKAPFSYIDTQSHGDLVNRIVNDVDFISDGMLQGFTQLFSGIIMIIGTFVFMVILNGTIALLVVLLTPISILFAMFISKRTFGMAAEQTRTQGEISGYISEIISQQKVVKAFSYEQRAQKEFDQINQKLHYWGFRAQLYPAFTNPITRFINSVVYAAVGIAGAFVVIKGGMSIGQLSSFLSYANQYTKPFNEVSGIAAQLQTALSAGQRVFELLDAPEEAPQAANVSTIEQAQGNFVFDHVDFSYVPNKPFIQNLSLHVKKGQRIAIVGIMLLTSIPLL
ncbi:MAG: ABC transporter ATP-binding protein [Clostridiales bacterium]|nr:ABC transporter ATP-binding protein [Clostridiales bacterium]